jgi:lipoyl(octanoyl) transferase
VESSGAPDRDRRRARAGGDLHPSRRRGHQRDGQRRLRRCRLLRGDRRRVREGALDAVWRWLGRAPFEETTALQERLRAAVLSGEEPETLLFCEHAPVITRGRSALAANILAPAAELERRGLSVEQASRGGDVTYHGPGQLVGYPVVRLRGGVVDHMTAMARAISRAVAELGVATEFRRSAPGLWTNDEKLCAFGVHIRSRVAIHGFALNVTTDLEAFNLIVPCGLVGARVTSLARLLAPLGVTPPPLEILAARIARELGAELNVTFHANSIAMSNGITRMNEA